jgi:FkbM family methyltransferase
LQDVRRHRETVGVKYERGWAYPDADTFMIHEMKDDGSYQGGHLQLALRYVTDWSCAIDGGAHVGTWSKPLGEKFSRVIAIEPSPDTFEALQANLQAFDCRTVDAHQVALGATVGWVQMTNDQKNIKRGNTGGRFVQRDGPIAMTTIDTFAVPTLGFLKLDVEGSEYAALLGAEETLRRCHPIVLFENKKGRNAMWGDPEGPQKFLTSLGYRQLERASCDLIWGLA